jgi:hypothetical protein
MSKMLVVGTMRKTQMPEMKMLKCSELPFALCSSTLHLLALCLACFGSFKLVTRFNSPELFAEESAPLER